VTAATVSVDDHVRYVLRLADDALVLAQRLSEWTSRAPDLEEDMALTNIALDLLGQARTLLAHAGALEGRGRTEDDLAYLRDEREFTNVRLVEHENGDFAVTMARQLLFSTYQLPLYERLQASTDETLAGVAAKAVKEVTYHQDFAAAWTRRLGDGTEESHARMQRALDRLWPFVDEMFDVDDVVKRLTAAGIAVNPADLRPEWDRFITAVLAESTLRRPQLQGYRQRGGRDGLHTQGFGYLLAEMQHIHRSYPGATW
jgi:ring-1,2-phenylacetyl-CoA epoxidase subunit PaaC